MASSREERASAILDVLEKDFFLDAHEIFERAAQTVGKIPAQPNNEFRNALIHLGRAPSAKSDVEFARQISMARWHIANAKRDCFKIVIRYLRDELTADLFLIGEVPSKKRFARRLRKVLRQIEDEFVDVRLAERKNDHTVTGDIAVALANDEAINDRFERLWTACNGLKILIHENIPNLGELKAQRELL
jgi:hypothetical protein